MPYDLALDAIIGAARRCHPPLDDETAKQKVDSAYGRYQPSEQLESGQGEITLLAKDAIKVVLNSPAGPVEFTFRDMTKSAFDTLEANMNVGLLQPGSSLETYQSRINLLSQSGREGVRRELQHIIGVEHKTLTVLFNRAIQEAQRRFLDQPRAVRVTEIASPGEVEYIVGNLILDTERPTILFGPGGSLKTFIMMSILLSVAAGHDWLGRPVQKRNCLLVDYETGQGMAGYRLRSLARGLGLEDGLPNIHWWDPDGTPFYDLTEPLKRDIAALKIGFLGIDHCAAASGMEPEKSEAATRFYRALSRLKVPTVALAHVTPTLPTIRECGYAGRSIFWENGAALTWFVHKEEQEEESPHAKIGLFQRKWNDTGRLRDFSLQFLFDGDVISVEQADLRGSPGLREAQGPRWVVWDALSEPVTATQIHEMTSLTRIQAHNALNKYAAMFMRVPGFQSGGRGHEQVWQRNPQFRDDRRQTVSETVPYIELSQETLSPAPEGAEREKRLETVSEPFLAPTETDCAPDPFDAPVPELAASGTARPGDDLPW